MNVRAFGKSEKGMHLQNEDAFLIDLKQGLFAVADGVTTIPFSRRASRAAVEILRKNFRGDLPAAVMAAHREISRMPETGATTLTAAWIHDRSLEVAHVGDSALFLVRKRVEKITKEDALPETSVLTQVLGKGEIRLHQYRRALGEGDSLVLATDGIANFVTGQEMGEAVQGLEKAPGKLIALARGKPKLYEDDKTAVVVGIT